MKERKLSIEFIRIFAIILTIMIHVSNIYIYNFGNISNSNYLIGIIYNAIARICVPLFFMISGIFLIKEEFDFKKYKKRIKKFLFLLIAWSIIYVLIYHKNNYLDTFMNMLFNANKTSRHLWFMYAIIGIYIALPFIQNMCKNLTKEQENLFLVLWMFFSGGIVIFVPLARMITNSNIDISYPIPIINAAYYLGYFISGHILYERYHKEQNNPKNNIIYLLIFTAATLITIMVTYILSIKNNSVYDSFLWYRSIFIVIASFMIFLLVITNEGVFKHKVISNISSLSFGVYLIHIIFIILLKKYFNIISYNAIWMIPIVTILIYLCSYLSCYIISKIPVINKFIK